MYGEWCNNDKKRVSGRNVEGVVTGVNNALGHGLRFPRDGYWSLLGALLDHDTKTHLLIYNCPRVRGKYHLQLSQSEEMYHDTNRVIKIITRKKHFQLDSTYKPFTHRETNHITCNLKNWPAAEPDGISNYHLGPRGIQALTDSPHYSYSRDKITNIWIHGTIITILKPNKDRTLVTSYRPIILLSTARSF